MKSILILDAFITDKQDEELLNGFIDSVKSINDDIMLMSNTTISKETQEKIEYLFYDKRNQLFKEKYSKYDYVNYWTSYEGFKVSNWFPHTQNHGLSVLINLFRAVKITKELGYTHFYKMEYDAKMNEETKEKIKNFNLQCVKEDKKGIFFVDDHVDHSSMSVHYFFCDIDYFLQNFWDVTCEQDYINFLDSENNDRHFLIMERFMYENVKKLNPNDVIIKKGFFDEFEGTVWNTKQTRVYGESKYNDCISKFYLIKDNPKEIVIYSRNVKSNPELRHIVVKFNNGEETKIIHKFNGYGSWFFNILPNNVEKMVVYDEKENFLYEEYFEGTINVIEFY
jgi:hypothetical protein